MVSLERGVCLVHRKPVFILVDVDGERHVFDVFPWVSKSRIVWHRQLAESVKCSKPGKQGRQEEEIVVEPAELDVRVERKAVCAPKGGPRVLLIGLLLCAASG
jgi:hypothetical protein